MPGTIVESGNTDGPRELQVIVCGAGLAGLAATIALLRKGHSVEVFDRAAGLSEIGAGIQIPPNSSRILDGWGLSDVLRPHVVWPENIILRRYADGKILGRTPLHPEMTKIYYHPYWLVHRAEYQQLLYERAVQLGAKVHFSCIVEYVDPASCQLLLADGRCFSGDVIVGADGIRSKVRDVVVPEKVEPNLTTNCAYRAIVSGADMLDDPETAPLMADTNATSWIGPGQHAMAYPIRQGSLYNLVLSHPNRANPGDWSTPGDLVHMKAAYAHFDPLIQRVLLKVKSCLKWALADLPPLSRWVSESGLVVVIGDAAHAMVPYLAQGASMGIEDGAALGECLGGAVSAADVPRCLAVFEKIRKPRCERIQICSRLNGEMWHLPDGPEQQTRDVRLKGDSATANPNFWSDAGFQQWLFGYDVVAETRDAVASALAA